MNHAMNHWANEATNQWIKGIDKSTNQWSDEPLNRGLSESKWIREPMNQWSSESMNESMNQWYSQSCSDPISFFLLLWNWALVTVLCATSSSKSALQPSVFYDSLVRSSSRYSLVHVFPTSSKVLPTPQLFNILKCKSGSRYCLVDTRKNKGFVPESVLTREFTRFRPLTLPNYLMMGLTWSCGRHDDGIDIMMCLTWWWCAC